MNKLQRAKQLQVKHTLVTKAFITATVVSSDKSTYYTPMYWFDGKRSCGCVSMIINEKVCKHLVAMLLSVNRQDLVDKMLEV